MSRAEGSDTRSTRSMASSRKKYENLLVDTTFTFNRLTKEIQDRIKHVNESFNNPVELAQAAQILESSKEDYKKVINELNNLFLQGKWDESKEVKSTVGLVGSKYLQEVDQKFVRRPPSWNSPNPWKIGNG